MTAATSLQLSETKQKYWIEILRQQFAHPSIILWRAIEAKYIERILNRYALPEPILDLGCAEGKIANALFKNKHLFGLDNTWNLIKQNKNTETYKALILADGCQMPFEDSSFGTVFSNCVIEHIADLNSLLSETGRVLKKDGLFIFTVPSDLFGEFLFFNVILKRLGFKGLADWYSRKRDLMLHHFHCYSHKVWQEKLKEKSLVMTEYVYYMPKEAVMLWDLLAGIVFIADKIKIFKRVREEMMSILKYPMYQFYDQESISGGALLIVARKS